MAHEIIFILDKSGSMQGTESHTINGYNSFLKKQKDEAGNTLVTTILFNDTLEQIHTGVDIRRVQPLSEKVYRVGGSTALLDAVGRSIETVKNRRCVIGNEKEDDNESVAFVIITDGYENASKEFTYDDIRIMIDECQKRGWEFIFLGADLRESNDADRMGIRNDRKAFYSKNRSIEVYDELSKTISALKKDNQIPEDWDRIISQKKSSINIDGPSGSDDLIFIQSMDKKLLIDTGSPISFGDIRYVEIGGNIHPLSSNHLLDDIRKHLAQDISGIIGMDILNQYNLLLFPDGNGHLVPEIIKRDVSYYFNERHGQIAAVMGIPVVTVDVDGMSHRFFVDTGSKITYISYKMSSHLNRTGYEEDFYPMLGTFKVDTYSFKASIIGHQFTVNAGSLPDSLRFLLPPGIEGILGIDVLKQFSVCFEFKSGKFSLKQ